MWIVEALQKRDAEGAPSGIWHLCARSDEGGGFVACCEHEHTSATEAGDCDAAQDRAARVAGIARAKAAPTVAELARVAFEAYGAAAGGKTWDGKDIPPFEAIRERTPHVASAWEAAADAVRKAVRP